jgi:hypothetical protein
MANRILSVQTLTVSSTQTQISVPDPRQSVPDPQTGFGEFQYADNVVYYFDNFTGSFSLVQTAGDTAGLKIYDTSMPWLSGPWRVNQGPTWLYNSGSNSQTVTVTVVLDR